MVWWLSLFKRSPRIRTTRILQVKCHLLARCFLFLKYSNFFVFEYFLIKIELRAELILIPSFPGSFYPHSDSFLYPPIQYSEKYVSSFLSNFSSKNRFDTSRSDLLYFLGEKQQKLPGNERFSSSPFQRMSKLSQRIIFDDVIAVSS